VIWPRRDYSDNNVYTKWNTNDAQVLAWLKSKGEGHLTRINDILFVKVNRKL